MVKQCHTFPLRGRTFAFTSVFFACAGMLFKPCMPRAVQLQTAALQQSATTAAPVTLKVALWLKALHRSSHTALQPCSTAAQHPGKPAILQHSSRAAQEPSEFQLRRPCSIAAMFNCLAAVLPCSNHRTRQRSMFGLPKTALPVY